MDRGPAHGRAATGGANPLIPGATVRLWCAKIESVVGLSLLVGVVIPDLALHAGELPRSQHPDQERDKLGLKGTQIVLSALNQSLAYPREVAVPPYLELVIGIRWFLQCMNGTFMVGRAAYNATLPPDYRPPHRLHGAIFA